MISDLYEHSARTTENITFASRSNLVLTVMSQSLIRVKVPYLDTMQNAVMTR